MPRTRSLIAGKWDRTPKGIQGGQWTRQVSATSFALPEAIRTRATLLNLNLKEFIMNQQAQSDLELQVVDLGDAKEVTMGIPAPAFAEDNPVVQGRF